MNPWLTPYYWFNNGPLSGDVTQDISPYTNLLSPRIEMNFAGDHKIEQKVVSEVASYGKQLGIISEALLELATGNHSEKIERLRELNVEIEKVKEKSGEKLESSARDALDKLKESDPDVLQRILDSYLT